MGARDTSRRSESAGITKGIPLTTLIVGIVGIIGAYFVPEIRTLLGLDRAEPAPVSINVNVATEPHAAAPSADAQKTIEVPHKELAQTVPLKAAPSVAPTIPADEITVSGGAGALPDVAAVADDALALLRSSSRRVRGTVRAVQSKPDESLQGLITTDLILDIRLLDSNGIVRESFTLTSRGGGFTSEASALQARERLHASLRARLAKEDS